MSTEFQELTKDEAQAIVQAHPWDQIHCFMGMFGADWDKQAVLDEIAGADRVAWSPHMIRHELAVKKGRDVMRFDIQRSAS